MVPIGLNEPVTATAQVTNRLEFSWDGTRQACQHLGCPFADIRPGTDSDPGITRICPRPAVRSQLTSAAVPPAPFRTFPDRILSQPVYIFA
jgi:hypothetical protein